MAASTTARNTSLTLADCALATALTCAIGSVQKPNSRPATASPWKTLGTPSTGTVSALSTPTVVSAWRASSL
jgi:hypothetical protein